MTSMIAKPALLGPAWTYGDKLRKIRREVARVSQARMAALIGVNSGTYSAWEGGRAAPRPAQARDIAQRLQAAFPDQVSAAWILNDSDGPIPVDTSYLSLVSEPLLPRMDSNHQPPDYGFRFRIWAGHWHSRNAYQILKSQVWETPVNRTCTTVNYQKASCARNALQVKAGVHGGRRVDARGRLLKATSAVLLEKRGKHGAAHKLLSGKSHRSGDRRG